MRTFVIGGAGFVGGALVRHLLGRGFEVVALARLGANLRQLTGLPVSLVHGDLSDVDLLTKSISGCDWVFHVAA
jgi:dihydroflavonol-4-reductase